MQAVAPQQLTAPVDTATYATPTLSFGEVGETLDQQTTGYATRGAGVGIFNETKLLERMVLIANTDWTTGSTGVLWMGDIDMLLRQNARNKAVMQQFHYYRADIEVTIRLNTNQFYYGALMATLFPTYSTGDRTDERAVLDPVIISASLADSVVKTWTYSHPVMWLQYSSGPSNFPTRLYLDILAPLTTANDSMPDSISVQIWARYKNIELSYPNHPIVREAQSGRGDAFSKQVLPAHRGNKPKVKVRARKTVKHPVDDQNVSSGYETLDALQSITLGDLAHDTAKIVSNITNPLSWFFDKPDHHNLYTIAETPQADMFLTDVPDTNVVISSYKDRYLDPSSGRLPMSKDFSVSDYARIPGLRRPVFIFNATGQSIDTELIGNHPDRETYAIPLDYAWLSSALWRGSIKLCLQFFTSSFISARFTMQYINAESFPGSYPSDYTAGLSKVINVKGDTVDTTIIPWLNDHWWTSSAPGEIRIKLESKIACTDTVADPLIYMMMWVSGGDDIQFAFPTAVYENNWSNDQREAQSSIGDIFIGEFTPLVENVSYDIDNGLCHGETLGSISSICKRYSPIEYSQVQFNGRDIDKYEDIELRKSIYGTWRRAFLYRSGGTKIRYYGNKADIDSAWRITSAHARNRATVVRTSPDGLLRVTLPQLGTLPFQSLIRSPVPNSQDYMNLTIVGDPVLADLARPMQIAARDDLQFGYPILPSRYPAVAQRGDKKALPIKGDVFRGEKYSS